MPRFPEPLRKCHLCGKPATVKAREPLNGQQAWTLSGVVRINGVTIDKRPGDVTVCIDCFENKLAFENVLRKIVTSEPSTLSAEGAVLLADQRIADNKSLADRTATRKWKIWYARHPQESTLAEESS
jgi:hypothetical protein